MADTQVLFRIEKQLLEALDRILRAEGFKTRNEWFRAQIRRSLEEAHRKRAGGLLDRLTVKGLDEDDVLAMVRDWRSKKAKR